MKKVILFIHSLRFGGAEKIVTFLLKNTNYDISLYLIENKIQYDINTFNKIFYFENEYKETNKIINFFKIFWYSYRYSRFCNKNKIDCSISFLTRPNIISVFSKILGNKSRIVISEHSLPTVWYNGKDLKSYLAKILIKKFYSFADEIIAVSSGVKKDLEKLGIKKEKIRVVYNFVDKNDIEKKKMEKVYDFKFDKFTFVSIGRLDSKKNHQLLIKSMQFLPKDTQLLIIGDGELRERLSLLIEELNLKDRVFLIGYKKNPYKYLSKSNCFVFSSKQESFGIVLLEAIFCGLPVISTDCPVGPREILSNSNDDKSFYEKSKIFYEYYGILVENNNKKAMIEAMREIYKNTGLRNSYKNKINNYINKDNELGTEYFRSCSSS